MKGSCTSNKQFDLSWQSCLDLLTGETECPAGCCPEYNWVCCSDNYCAAVQGRLRLCCSDNNNCAYATRYYCFTVQTTGNVLLFKVCWPALLLCCLIVMLSKQLLCCCSRWFSHIRVRSAVQTTDNVLILTVSWPALLLCCSNRLSAAVKGSLLSTELGMLFRQQALCCFLPVKIIGNRTGTVIASILMSSVHSPNLQSRLSGPDGFTQTKTFTGSSVISG